jgi:hypothetical protein
MERTSDATASMSMSPPGIIAPAFVTGWTKELKVEAERINLLANLVAGLQQRAADLRRYL